MKAPEESEDGKEARHKVLTYPLNFIPGTVEVQSILKAMESGGDMFDADGHPTQELVRVLGMRPKKELLQDLSPEDWLEYETGFKQRTH
jgi:hypothetical protein